MQQIMIYW